MSLKLASRVLALLSEAWEPVSENNLRLGDRTPLRRSRNALVARDLQLDYSDPLAKSYNVSGSDKAFVAVVSRPDKKYDIVVGVTGGSGPLLKYSKVPNLEKVQAMLFRIKQPIRFSGVQSMKFKVSKQLSLVGDLLDK